VCLAHSGDTGDVDHLSELADLGYFLGMDRFGVDVYAPFDVRVDTIVQLIERGYVEHLGLAHDASCYLDWIDQSMLSMTPNWNYLHISNDVLPELEKRGVTAEQIDTLLVANPSRWIAGTP
jgi:phosphotriesterase-related protein